MTIVVPNLEEETRLAWEEYLAAVRDLAGSAYDEAEPAAWEDLQLRLAAVADDEPAQPLGHLG